MRYVYVMFFLFQCSMLHGQSPLLWSEKNEQNEISLQYENDLFARQDMYYSQGIGVMYKHRLKEHIPFSLLKAERSKRWSLGLEHQVFTPSTIRSSLPLYTDQPYAATLCISGQLESFDSSYANSLGLGLTVGFSGPKAGGEEMQTAIHKATSNFLPLGWEYQLPQGLVVDIMLRRLTTLAEYRGAALRCFGQLNMGTRMDDLSLGILFQYETPGRTNNWGIAVQSQGKVVAYDGRLQGMLGAPRAVVAVKAAELSRWIAEEQFKVYARISRVRVELWYTFQSKQFSGATSHWWGGVRLMYFL